MGWLWKDVGNGLRWGFGDGRGPGCREGPVAARLHHLQDPSFLAAHWGPRFLACWVLSTAGATAEPCLGGGAALEAQGSWMWVWGKPPAAPAPPGPSSPGRHPPRPPPLPGRVWTEASRLTPCSPRLPAAWTRTTARASTPASSSQSMRAAPTWK